MSGPFSVFTPLATVWSASMSRPESVSSRIAISGRCRASWRISMRFFSPPEKPSFKYREEKSLGTSVSAMASSTVLRKSLRLTGSSPRCSRWRVHDRAQVLGDRHDSRNRDRVLERHEEAHARALVGIGLGDVLAVVEDLALGHLQVGVTHDRVRQGRLAGAVRPHQRVDLPGLDLQVEPLQDLLLAPRGREGFESRVQPSFSVVVSGGGSRGNLRCLARGRARTPRGPRASCPGAP